MFAPAVPLNPVGEAPMENKSDRRARRPTAPAVAAIVVIALGTLVGAAVPQYSISQKGREFRPGEISIKRGDTIQIVNDDGDLLHHAYVEFAKILIRFGRPGAGQQDQRHLPGGGRLRRAVRHSSEDAAAGARTAVRRPEAPHRFGGHSNAVPNIAAWTP